MRRSSLGSAWILASLVAVNATACSRPPASREAAPAASSSASASPSAVAPAVAPTAPSPLASASGGTPCTTDPAASPPCFRFADAAAAFRWILAFDAGRAGILAIGEAHAQKGSEAVASATKRFTESMLPLLHDRASELLVEAWAPDPRCKREVKAVASAQAPVKQAQAEANDNEYVTLGTRARAAGITPYLLRPTCDDFASLADVGDGDAIAASLGLIKRLTQTDATRFFEKNRGAEGGGATAKLVVTYGGAMHNDLAPSPALRPYSFGPELAAITAGHYVELDLIVPEYVKDTDAWRKLPWYAAWQADARPKDRTTVYRVGDRSFVLFFPSR